MAQNVLPGYFLSMRHGEALAILGEIQSLQWGLCTSAQAKACGVDTAWLRRLAERGSLVRVRHGVYTSPAIPVTPQLEIQSEWLAIRPSLLAAQRLADPHLAAEAVVSHTTAANLWEIGDLWPDGVHFTLAKRRRSRQPDVTLHKALLGRAEWTIHEQSGLPVTTVARTVADLARAGNEASHLGDLIQDAAHLGLVTQLELVVSLSGLEEALGFDKGAARDLMEWCDGLGVPH